MNNNKLKAKLVELGCSQTKLAKSLGITLQSLNRKLNGKSKLTLEEVNRIILILGIENPSDIFFD